MKSAIRTLGRTLRPVVSASPWTNVYGMGRTLVALGTLGTLLFSSTTSLFTPAQGLPSAPYCSGVANVSAYCLTPAGHLGVAKWVSIAILVAVVSGWRPRLTAVPHWWVTFSLASSATIPDGGDQISMNIALLLIPISLTDKRRWHWTRPALGQGADRPLAATLAWSAWWVIRLQVAGLYFQACVAKLSHDEWANGTALYYWMNDPLFGLPEWARGVMEPVLLLPLGVQVLTWGPLVIEFLLFAGLFMTRRHWSWLLWLGLSLHFGIGLFMGLWSFAFAMFGCLVLYLRPLDRPLTMPWPRAANPSKAQATPDTIAPESAPARSLDDALVGEVRS